MKKIVIVLSVLVFANIANAQYSPYDGITVAGGNGIGDGDSILGSANAVYVDGSGNIYVVDGANDRIMKFPAGSTSATDGVAIAGVDVPGADSDSLSGPVAIFLDSSGNIYVADEGNNRIQEFPAGSTFGTNAITVAGGNGPGSGNNQLNDPSSVFIDRSGNIYVADANNNRILKFPSGSTSATYGITVVGGNTGGGNTAANQLSLPAGVFLDTSGNIYVSDAGNNRVQEFPSNSDSTTNGVTVAGGNDTGNALNQLFDPGGIYVDKSGNLFVADIQNDRVLEFPPGSTSATSGVIVAGIDGEGIGPDQLYGPSGVFLDDEQNLYVADNNNQRVQEFLTGKAGIIKVENENIKVTVAPNPFSENTILMIELPVAQEVSIQVFNVLGQEVEAQDTQLGFGKNTLTVANNLEAGAYFLRLTSGTFSESVKIVATGK